MLSGSSLHNPDLLINKSGFGTNNCILVDAKDPNVNSYSIITLRGELLSTVKRRSNSALDEFDRVCILEEKALEMLLPSKQPVDKILDFILPLNGFKHITILCVKKKKK